MHVTTGDMHDSEALPNLMANTSRHRATIEAFMDEAYDSSKNYALLRGMSIKPIIKPKRNSRTDRGPLEEKFSHNSQNVWGEGVG
jgi:hypothetical protein